ncbi:MAG: helix-hairpin-helix domain-containing protein [Cyclobacteriaceae bacterium]
MKALLLYISLGLLAPRVFAQETAEQAIDLQRFSDDLLGFQDVDTNYEDLYENLVQILSSPYDLNKVSEEELRSLHILTDLQIANFITYRSEQGTLLDVYELQVIPEFDLTLISRLLPFVKVNDPSKRVSRSLIQRMFSMDRGYIISRYERTLESSKGFRQGGDSSAFSGSPDKLYFRLRSAEAGDYSIGLTGEKDAGEKIAFNPRANQWGFDFTSFHVQVRNKGKLKNIIAGDFQAQFAQGLTLGGAFGLGKGGESVSTARKSHLGFLPYTSINESAYLRGVGITLQPFEHFTISAFYSGSRRDASVVNATDTLTVTSFQSTGFHRTRGELENRKKVAEENYGLVVHFAKNNLDAGVIINVVNFGIPVKRASTLYNQTAFAGSQNLNTGIFLNYRVQNVSIFSEAVQSLSAGRGMVAGLLVSPHRNFDLAIVYRNYMRNFYTFYSNAFSENTQPQNERGVYWGWKYRWNRQYNLTGYMDMFTFPWLGFRRYAPSQGYEWLMRGSYNPTKKISIFVQVREELKSRNLPVVTTVYGLDEGVKRNVTVNCDYGVGEKIRLKSRAQYNSYFFNKSTTEGIALVQDLSFSLGPLQFTGRHALFDTDHHDNRQYVYENDAWLAYSLPAYSGVGVRNYVLIEYKVHKQLTIWVRYARTQLLKGAEIGSGQDLIEGNTKNDIKFQARFEF